MTEDSGRRFCGRRSWLASTMSISSTTSRRRSGRYGKTKRIISFHDFNGTPETLEERYGHMCTLDADIVKIVTMAQKPEDNIRLLKLIKGAKVPTVRSAWASSG